MSVAFSTLFNILPYERIMMADDERAKTVDSQETQTYVWSGRFITFDKDSTMHKQSKTRAVVALTLMLNVFISLLPRPLAAAADIYETQGNQRSAGAMAVDVIAVRPLGFVATVLGTGLFVVSLPFSALGGNVGEAAENLVVAPARFTFVRPLGEYDGY